MPATSLDLSQIKTDALSSAAAFRALIGLGTLATVSPTGTPDGTKFLRDDGSWQAVNLSAYLPLAGGTMTGALAITQATANTSVLTSTGYSLTGSNAQSLVDVAGTWNTTGTPTLIKANVTDTASNAASLLMDLQVGGSSRFRVRKDGNLTLTDNSTLDGPIDYTNGTARFRLQPTYSALLVGSTHAIDFSSGYADSGALSIFNTWCLGWGSNNGFQPDLRIFRDAADTLAQRRSTNPQVHRIYGTFTDASNYRRLFLSSTTAGAFTLGVEGAGTGASGNTLTLGNPVSVTGGTITASTPAIDVTQTWNNAATTFTGILSNVTDTASNANSLLLDLQVGGSSRFSVNKGGQLRILGSQTEFGSAGVGRAYINTSAGLNLASGQPFGWSPNTDAAAAAIDTILVRDAAGTLGIRNSTNAQIFRIYNTFTDASNYERAKIAWESDILRIGTEKAGTGSARALELQTNGTTRLTIAPTGNVGIGSLTSEPLHVSFSNSDGGASGVRIQNTSTSANNSYAGVQIYAQNGTVQGDFTTVPTAGSVVSGGGVVFRTVTNHAMAFRTNDTTRLTISNTGLFTIADALNIAVGTTTGTKIGTATNQKLGFYNATPVVQPTAVADATDAASVITQLNALLSRMRDLGLIAT